MMATARIELPPKLIPVFSGEARYRCAYGGRGSGKTRSFALMTAVKAYQESKAGRTGIILCCREFMNSLEDSSFSEVKSAIQSCDWLALHFDIGEKYIRTVDKRVSYSWAGLRNNIDSVKSKSRILLTWVDEAESVLETSWSKLILSVREDKSEVWVTWNPESERGATHRRFRASKPKNMLITSLNYTDNPWFPRVLELERLSDLEARPADYNHVWLGEFKTVTKGAYFSAQLAAARQAGRIGRISADPLMTMRAFWDIGGTGAKSDACAIWIVQFIGREIRVLNYYEAQGQPLATHVQWLRASGYERALCVLPHDGATSDKVYKVTYESSLKEAGFSVKVIPNQGAGAAKMRIEAVRRLFPSIWINEATTHGGVEALGAYHAKIDEKRGIDLGPNHDWSSHAADAFGLMAVDYEIPNEHGPRDIIQRLRGGGQGTVGGWQGA